MVKDPVERGRAHFDGAFKRFSIQGFADGRADIGDGHASRRNELLRVDGVTQRKLRAKSPTLENQRQRDIGIQVKTTEQRSGAEVGLAAREPFGCGLELAVK